MNQPLMEEEDAHLMHDDELEPVKHKNGKVVTQEQMHAFPISTPTILF
jgi:hypothetical protein